MSIYNSYAKKICKAAGAKVNHSYDNNQLSNFVMAMPFGGREWIERANELPRLGEEVPLNKHMLETFFSMVASDKPLETMTSPVMVDHALLTRWKYWDDWKTLEQYLGSLNLIPVLTFQHYLTHARRDGKAIYGVVSDIRVVLNGKPYEYYG